MRVSNSSDGSKDSEVERLVRRSFSLYSDGAVTKAVQQLQAVQVIIQGQPRYDYLSQFLKTTLGDWNSERDSAGRRKFIDDVLAAATRLLESDGGHEQAAALLDSAILLYSGDSAVEEQLVRCREFRRQIGDE